MQKSRVEAFSDGVIAIIITIMVLEIKVPHGESFEALAPLAPIFFNYVLSFTYIGIFWNNHHHLLHSAKQVNARVMWANLHLLFWISLLPFASGWMSENHFASLPVAFYSFILLMSAIAYSILSAAIINADGKDSLLAKAIGKDCKGKVSITLFLISIPTAFVAAWISEVLIVATLLIWLVPDRRIEKFLNQTNS